MHIVHHPRCKDDIQDENRATLPVMRQTNAHGQWIVSFWKPSAVELESLITGGGVEMHIKAVAHHHPIVTMATWPAVGPELIDGDSFMQRTTGYRCLKCCAKEGQPHAGHCIDVISAIHSAQSKLTQDPGSGAPPALTFMDLSTRQIAAIYRAAGYKISANCAAEEAFILERMLCAVAAHGDKWARVFAAQLRVAQDAAIEMDEASAAKHEAATFKKTA